MDAQGREQPLVFGEVAELYDQSRPGYPEVVFDRVVEFGELRPGDPALEVGCRTGHATRPLAARGLLVTALEPSPEMARVARQKTRDLVGVRVEDAWFEDWALPREPLRLVTSAQAWDWVRPEVRFIKAREALGDGDRLAFFWNSALNQGHTNSGLDEAINDVYRREVPHLAAGVPEEVDVDRRLEIEASGLFVDAIREDYPWSTTDRATRYLGQLQAQSDHRLLEPAARGRLLDGLAAVLAAHGDAIDKSYCTCLYLARRHA